MAAEGISGYDLRGHRVRQDCDRLSTVLAGAEAGILVHRRIVLTELMDSLKRGVGLNDFLGRQIEGSLLHPFGRKVP